jgi:hypothetical protein
MMNNNLKKFFKIVSLSAISLLTACGGGGAGTGSLTEFSVLPNDWTLSFPKGNTTCSINPANRPEITVTIVGGSPPYRIVNSHPQWLTVSATTLNEKNPSFKVFAEGGCGDSLGILILDNQSRSINFTATLEAGEEIVSDSTL